MIRFDTSQLSVEIVSMKTVTTSLGGSITIVDPAKSVPGKEAHTRMIVPMAVARSFIMKTKKVTRYLKPVLVGIVRYEGTVVAMERHPLASMGTLVYEGFDGKPRTWEPDCFRNLSELVKPLIDRGDRQWYFDGRYAYSFQNDDVDVAIRSGDYMTADGRFRKVIATTVDLQELSTAEKLEPSDRSCLAFVTSNGQRAISPPIWKNLSDVGSTALRRESDDDGDDEDDDITPVDAPVKMYNFDKIDETLAVNLNFALKAGNEIGRVFGYEYVEPLQMPRLMIELHTVNLPNVPKQIKSTYDVGIRFTHTLAWLLGMSRNADTLETYVMMRSLLKYLTKKGIYRNSTFDASRIFRDGKTVTDVVKHDLNVLLKDNTTQMSLGAILDQARMGIKARRRESHDIHQIGGLLNEE